MRKSSLWTPSYTDKLANLQIIANLCFIDNYLAVAISVLQNLIPEISDKVNGINLYINRIS